LSSQTVARRYASALADVIVERGEESRVREELRAWEKMILGNELFFEPYRIQTLQYEEKKKLINDLITRTKVGLTTANFLRILLKNQRLADIAQVNAKLAQVLDERSGVVNAQVRSARPVSDGIRASLEEKLKQLTGKRIRLTFDIDETLLGGIVTTIDSTIYDGSVRNQLERLGEALAG
jgi:F-type H+-transporting ATPase subunit delta